MDAQCGGGFGKVSGVPRQSGLDVELFKFRKRFVEQYAAVEHLAHQGFHFLTHSVKRGKRPLVEIELAAGN